MILRLLPLVCVLTFALPGNDPQPICLYKHVAKQLKRGRAQTEFDLLGTLREAGARPVVLEGLTADLDPAAKAAGAGGQVAVAETIFPGGEIPPIFAKLSALQRDFLAKEGAARTLFYLGRLPRVAKFDPALCPGPEGCLAKMQGSGLEDMLLRRGEGFTVDRRAKDLLFIEEAWKDTYRLQYRRGRETRFARVSFGPEGQVASFTIRDADQKLLLNCVPDEPHADGKQGQGQNP